jgi:hypothetical protein
MRVIDLDTSKNFYLDLTPELKADLAPIDAACTHPRRELRQRRNKGGAIQYIEQCLRCGDSVGLFHKHTTDLATSPVWDEKLEDEFHATRLRDREAVIQKHVRIQRGRSEGFWKEYSVYLNSDDWRQKRTRVLQRAKGRCEGCGVKAATQVHHLTYKHAFAEFLFELVAICDDCHGRLHSDETEPEEIGEHPCCGCRHQSEHENKVWCFAFDMAADEARAEGGECGPQRGAFEPLK